MARIPLAQQHTAPARESHDSQNSQDRTVLPFPSAYIRRRDEVCVALRGLADAWQQLPIRDEVAWAAFAADAALALARYLLQHAADVRSATLERGHHVSLDDVSPAADAASSTSDAADEQASGGADAEAEHAANAAVLALVGLTCALGSDDAEAALLHLAVGTGAAVVTEPKPDLTHSRRGARQVS